MVCSLSLDMLIEELRAKNEKILKEVNTSKQLVTILGISICKLEMFTYLNTNQDWKNFFSKEPEAT